MWKIGSIEIKNQVVIAPMAGISNPVFRQVCKDFGAGLTVSEMISDKALHYQNQRTFDMCRTFPTEHPVSLQLFGNDPKTMQEATLYLQQHTDCDIIDVNMGCPVTKVLKAHAGSWLLQDVGRAKEIVEAMVKVAKVPITVKMRIGYDAQHIHAVEFAQALEEAGASAITVHGRTRSQMYEGHADYSWIKKVKEAVRIPVIANGDIRCGQDAKNVLEETNCDAVMIGRGVLGKPYRIKEILSVLEGTSYTEPSDVEKVQLCIDYAEKLCAYQGEHTGVSMMRGMGAWYLAGLSHSAPVRKSIALSSSLQELKDHLSSYQKYLMQKEEK